MSAPPLRRPFPAPYFHPLFKIFQIPPSGRVNQNLLPPLLKGGVGGGGGGGGGKLWMSRDNESVREELGTLKVEINWNNCYSDEYATDIKDIVNKTILQEVTWSLLINDCSLGWCGIITF